ncbi:unnamed protein product [Protopolystoma xenopodis]|uniref:Uncharacterized protein n=1 Tax=Protopolystoma xenopodis TaxID=117903 RepID=A0A3S5C5P7_9PLAT|nr:unnamed protein product [Protopolystoma xenopodis]
MTLTPMSACELRRTVIDMDIFSTQGPSRLFWFYLPALVHFNPSSAKLPRFSPLFTYPVHLRPELSSWQRLARLLDRPTGVQVRLTELALYSLYRLISFVRELVFPGKKMFHSSVMLGGAPGPKGLRDSQGC